MSNSYIEPELRIRNNTQPECNCADWGAMDHLPSCPASWRHKPAKKNDEPVTWSGGPNPVPGKRVSVWLRGQQGIENSRSEDLYWIHSGTSHDIVQYRVVEVEYVGIGPDDFRGGEELKLAESQVRLTITEVQESGVHAGSIGFISYQDILRNYSIRRLDSKVFIRCGELVKRELDWSKLISTSGDAPV